MDREPAVLPEHQPGLRDWLNEITKGIGPSEVARASDAPISSVGKLLRSGSGMPLSLRKVVDAYNASALTAFVKAGWLTPDEALGKAPERVVSDDEWALIQSLRSVPPTLRPQAAEQVRGLLDLLGGQR